MARCAWVMPRGTLTSNPTPTPSLTPTRDPLTLTLTLTLTRRAIENTARVTANATGDAVDQWALGRGLIDVEAAHEWLLAHASYAQRDARFEARCTTLGLGFGQP